MDTDSITESLLLGVQTRIDKQTGPKQQLEWKQETYRDLITKINTSGDQYFSYYGSGQMNLLSTSLFKIIAGISDSSATKMGFVSSNTVSSMRVNAVKQLATTYSVRTAGIVTGELRGNDVDFTNFADAIGEAKLLSVTLDGVSRTIDFTIKGELSNPADPNSPEEVDGEKTLKNVNQVLYCNFGISVGMRFEEDLPNSEKGTMKLIQLNTNGVAANNTIDSSRRVIVETTGDSDSSNIIANLGFKGGFSGKLNYGTPLKDTNFSTPLQGNRFELDINGVTIKGLNRGSALGDAIGAIDSNDAGVKVSYLSASGKFIVESSSTGGTSNIEMGQRYGNLLTTMFGVEATGLQPSIFSKLIGGMDHMDLGSAIDKPNNGEDQSLVLQVDGQDFTVKLEGKIGSKGYKDKEGLINAINSKLDKGFSYGKIVFSWDDTSRQVTLKSSEHKMGFTGANLITGIASDLGSSEEDNVYDGSTELSSLGITGNIRVGNTTYHLGDPSVKTISNLIGIMDGTYVDGRINISDQTGGFTVSGNAIINGASLVGNLFGQENVEFTPVSNMLASSSVSDPTILKGALELAVSGGNAVAINADPLTDDFDGLAAAIRAGIGGNIVYTADGRLQVSGTTGEPTVKGTDDNGKELLNQLFSQDTVTFNPHMTASVVSGQDAVLVVDGTDIEHNTNTFESDGITMKLTSTYDTSSPSISLTTFRNTDKIIDSLKNFVDDYNAFIEELNKQLTKTANYEKHVPLTDAQKKEMSDKEVELREGKSKQGLPHDDPNTSSLLSETGMALYSSVKGAGLSLYDVGIETSDNWRDSDKLVIDEDALGSAIATNPDAISKLSTNRDQGLGIKTQNTIKAAANVSSGSPGGMARYAGTKDMFLTSGALYEEMKHISETLSNPNTRYELEKTWYWKQSTVMEQAISNMNSQGS